MKQKLKERAKAKKDAKKAKEEAFRKSRAAPKKWLQTDKSKSWPPGFKGAFPSRPNDKDAVPFEEKEHLVSLQVTLWARAHHSPRDLAKTAAKEVLRDIDADKMASICIQRDPPRGWLQTRRGTLV